MSLEKIQIENITICERTRQSPGPLTELMQSIDKVGLLNPITVDENLSLLAGFRRLECAKLLGWKTISAHIVNADSLQVELDENTCRLDFTPSEKLALVQRIANKMRKAGVSGHDALQIASDQAGVGRTDVVAIAKTMKDGSEELIEAMETGKIPVRKAAKIAKKPKHLQKQAIEEVEAEVDIEVEEQPEQKPTKKVKEEVTVDGLGFEVLPHAKQAFEVNKLVNKLIHAILTLYPLIDEIARHPGGVRYRNLCRHTGRGADATYKSNQIVQFIHELKRSFPYVTICPCCMRKDSAEQKKICPACYGENWVTKHNYSEAVPQSDKDVLLAKMKQVNAIAEEVEI
jgi:ParB family transcriptional regulator, chromosome partitioning protein